MRFDWDAARSGQRCRQRVSPTMCWTAAAAARPLRGQQAAGSTGAVLGSGCFEHETREPGQHFRQQSGSAASVVVGPELGGLR